VEALQDFPRLGGNGHAVLAMVARGGAAFDGIFKFLAAGAAGARALAGGRGCGHKEGVSELIYFVPFSKSICSRVYSKIPQAYGIALV
jgi:hypothetical protein